MSTSSPKPKDPSIPAYWKGVRLDWSDHAFEQSVRRNIPVNRTIDPAIMRLADCGYSDVHGFKYVFKICCEDPFHMVLSHDHRVITVFRAGQDGGSHYTAMTKKGRRQCL